MKKELRKRLIAILAAAAFSVCAFPLSLHAEESPAETISQEQNSSEELPTETPPEEESAPLTEETPSNEEIQTEPEEENIDPKDQENNNEREDSFLTEEESGHTALSSQESAKTERTVMIYLCGSDLESGGGFATGSIRQILASAFSKEERIRVIVMTGGTDHWFTPSEWLIDPSSGTSPQQISHDYNQIWEARGTDAPTDAGKLVLLDPDGVTGDGDDAVPSRIELMTLPSTLKKFIDYCVETAPAERYDLILWDHGTGPVNSYGPDENKPLLKMNLDGIREALSDNEIVRSGKKFDSVNFDACLMGSVEVVMALYDLTHCLITSPESIPADGQYYTEWLSRLAENPSYDMWELGKTIVDDYIEYYRGGKQDAALAVINTDLLMENDFGGMLKEWNDIFFQELSGITDSGEFLYYDELLASLRCIQYGDNQYYDFGNFLSMMGMAYHELDEDDIKRDSIDLKNRYTEIALKLLNAEEEAVYARSTDGMKKDGQYHLLPDGSIVYDNMLSTGLYIFFPDKVFDYSSNSAYISQIQTLTDTLPQDHPGRNFLNGYLDTILYTYLVYEAGNAVSALSDHLPEGKKKEEISYADVMYFWKFGLSGPEPGDDPEEGKFLAPYRQRVKEYLEFLNSHGHADIETWLKKLVRQLSEESVSKDNIEVTRIVRPDGMSYEIAVNNTRKRVLDSIRVNVLAELPAAKAYVEADPNIIQMLNFLGLSTEFRIGSVSGYQVPDFDFDNPDADLNAYIKWLNDPSVDWEISTSGDSWYAVRDADGVLHVLEVVAYSNGDIIANCYYLQRDETGKVTETLAAMIFSKENELKEIYLSEETGVRKLKPQDLLEPVAFMPVQSLFGGLFNIMIPISMSPVIIDPSTADGIRLEYVDVDEIADIADTDGDGKKITKQIILRDIYQYEYDLTELAETTDKERISIELAEAQDLTYNGKKQSPVITWQGEVLKEGTDYSWAQMDPEDNFTDAKEYEVLLYGNGRFAEEAYLKFRILPASISEATITGVWPAHYTGQPITQNPVIKAGNTVLKEGVDYELTYQDNIGPGTAVMTVIGKGNYTGELKAEFEILETEVFRIIYDLSGGTYDGSRADITEYYPDGAVITVHDAPVRKGYEFLYWKGSILRPGDSFTVTEDHTFTAQWKKKSSSGEDESEEDSSSGTGIPVPVNRQSSVVIPNTSDQNHTGFWLAVFLASLAVHCMAWIIAKKYS